jgi:hypothetical protein
MDLIDTSNIKIIGNCLTLPENIFHSCIPIPIGTGYTPKKHDLYKHGHQLFAVIRGAEPTQENRIQIYPKYLAQDSVDVPGIGNVKLEFWSVDTSQEWYISQEIISRTHYLKPVQRGMAIGCRFLDHEQEEKIRKIHSSRNTLPARFASPAWTNPPSRMIGCAILDSLSFGMPSGRDVFLPAIKEEEWWQPFAEEHDSISSVVKNKKITRGEAVHLLKLAWISRFAIEEPYVSIGLGSLLAKHAMIVASYCRFPKAHRIEVIRTVKKAEAEKLAQNERGDFLTKAGLSIASEHVKYSPPKREIDPETGVQIITKNNKNQVFRKLYYYADV